ncbi:hypothetical protein JVT61DRAFT_917 [Boletus reticuloceps]|uniref:Uncharacterized protein n=1 Tax=Boletus reticuloceps TaxID=495285 RepID=A0A8I2YRK0_9AGAM|nr:hypothetical protein JVT61DRAFT_917 [Boletus reticuloceps]
MACMWNRTGSARTRSIPILCSRRYSFPPNEGCRLATQEANMRRQGEPNRQGYESSCQSTRSALTPTFGMGVIIQMDPTGSAYVRSSPMDQCHFFFFFFFQVQVDSCLVAQQTKTRWQCEHYSGTSDYPFFQSARYSHSPPTRRLLMPALVLPALVPWPPPTVRTQNVMDSRSPHSVSVSVRGERALPFSFYRSIQIPVGPPAVSTGLPRVGRPKPEGTKRFRA